MCDDSIPGLRVHHLDISDLPIINTDLETDAGFPPAVEAFRANVSQADCFLFASPEYNYSITSTYFTSAAELGGCWVPPTPMKPMEHP